MSDIPGYVEDPPGSGLYMLDPQAVPLPTPTGWHTPDSARDGWLDAPDDDDQLWELLESARIQCEAYGPPVASPVPVNYRQAQLMQARNLWQSVRQDPGNQLGPDGMAITVFPLDWIVKALLRPKRGVPSFG